MGLIIGCDEVGRGPIAGPVVACALRLKTSKKSNTFLRELGVTDSKKLKASQRKDILEHFNLKNLKINKVYSYRNEKINFDFCLCEVSHTQIDKINILQASLLAMKKAVLRLNPIDENILIDGNKVFEIEDYQGKIDYLIKGDSKSVAIGLASIIAKNFRDEKMAGFDIKYPGFNFAKHAGYPTKAHREAVHKLGPSPIHRRSFKGVKEFL